jgi:serine/threonine protein kinase
LLPLPVVESALPEYPDLAKYIDARNRPHPLPLLELYSLISDIADGLSSLHDFGVVHGDIKPENILVFRTVNGDGITAKIADFGSIGIGITRDVPDAWTPLWVPPDYNPMCEESACPSVDIYSFGRVALYLCSEGALPEYPTAVERDIVLQCIAKLRNDDLSVLLDLLDTTLNLTSSERCKDISKTRQVLLGPQVWNCTYYEILTSQYQSPKLGRDTIIPFNKSISRTVNPPSLSSFDNRNSSLKFWTCPHSMRRSSPFISRTSLQKFKISLWITSNVIAEVSKFHK